MKLLLFLLLVILPASSVHSQEVREDIKQAIANWYSKSGHGHLINITKAGPAHPSQEFIDKYDPKETYCVICKAARTLRKVRVMARYGGPPVSEEVISEETTVSDYPHIAIIAQSGEIELINAVTMPGPFLAPPMPCKVRGREDKPQEGEDKVKRETKFQSLWREVCPLLAPGLDEKREQEYLAAVNGILRVLQSSCKADLEVCNEYLNCLESCLPLWATSKLYFRWPPGVVTDRDKIPEICQQGTGRAFEKIKLETEKGLSERRGTLQDAVAREPLAEAPAKYALLHRKLLELRSVCLQINRKASELPTGILVGRSLEKARRDIRRLSDEFQTSLQEVKATIPGFSQATENSR